MKYLLLSAFLFFSIASADENYLKIRSYPSYPSPGQPIPQTVNIIFSPSFPKDTTFENINKLLTKIASFEGHNAVPLHAGYISLELSWHGNLINTSYSKIPANSNPILAEHWKEVFKVLQLMTNKLNSSSKCNTLS